MARFCSVGGCTFQPSSSEIIEKRVVTVQKAEQICASLLGCKGFAYNPKDADVAAVEVHFFGTPLVCSYFGGMQNVCFYLQAEEDWLPLLEGVCESRGRALHHPSTSPWLAGDKQFMMAACHKLPSLLTHVSSELREDPDVALSAISVDEAAVEDVVENMWNNTAFVEALLEKDGMYLERASEQLRDDRETVIAAVHKTGEALRYASNRLKNDPDVVRAAVFKHMDAFQFASKELRGNLSFVTALVQEKAAILRHASGALRSDPDFITSLVDLNDGLLEYASDSLRQDKAFIRSIVERGHGDAIRHASPSIWQDAELILLASSKDKKAIRHAGKDAWNNKEFVMKMVKDSWKHLERASEKMRSDRDIAQMAIKQTPEALKLLSDTLREDPEIVFLVYAKDEGVAVKYARAEVFTERDFCFAIAGTAVPKEWSSDAQAAAQRIFLRRQDNSAKRGQVLTAEINPNSNGESFMIACRTLAGSELMCWDDFPSEASVSELRRRVELKLSRRKETRRAKVVFYGEEGSFVKDSEFLSTYQSLTVKIGNFADIRRSVKPFK